MGAKKDRDVEILTYRENKYKELAKNFKKFDISDHKIVRIEAKEAKAKKDKDDTIARPDY